MTAKPTAKCLRLFDNDLLEWLSRDRPEVVAGLWSLLSVSCLAQD